MPETNTTGGIVNSCHTVWTSDPITTLHPDYNIPVRDFTTEPLTNISNPAKPTTGPIARNVHDDDRILEIIDAIKLRIWANQKVAIEWMDELNDLIKTE